MFQPCFKNSSTVSISSLLQLPRMKRKRNSFWWRRRPFSARRRLTSAACCIARSTQTRTSRSFCIVISQFEHHQFAQGAIQLQLFLFSWLAILQDKTAHASRGPLERLGISRNIFNLV